MLGEYFLAGTYSQYGIEKLLGPLESLTYGFLIGSNYSFLTEGSGGVANTLADWKAASMAGL